MIVSFSFRFSHQPYMQQTYPSHYSNMSQPPSQYYPSSASQYSQYDQNTDNAQRSSTAFSHRAPAPIGSRSGYGHASQSHNYQQQQPPVYYSQAPPPMSAPPAFYGTHTPLLGYTRLLTTIFR